MFGRQAKKQRQQQEQARKEQRACDREEHWKLLFSGEMDEHERMRLFITYRQELLFDWLHDFDSRVAAEIREHARTTRNLLLFLIVIAALQLWPR
jgi:hypothetical protein